MVIHKLYYRILAGGFPRLDGCTLGYIDEVVYNERAAASKETGKSSAPGFAADVPCYFSVDVIGYKQRILERSECFLCIENRLSNGSRITGKKW